MIQWIVSSCVLILVVMALRALFGRRLRPGLRYALWGLVLLRLLIPGTVLQSGWSVASAVETVREQPLVESAETVVSYGRIPRMSYSQAYREVREQYHRQGVEVEDFDLSRASRFHYEVDSYRQSGVTVRDVLRWVWIAGSAVTALVFFLQNFRLLRSLRRRRVRVEDDCPLPVWAVEGLGSSCLLGNSVYVSDATAGDPEALRHVLAHELSHHRHGDHVWALLRCCALALHWWNPLVWQAAKLSRRDAELFADAGAISRLGEAERTAYGETLIRLSTGYARRVGLLCAATTMTGGKHDLKERITMIAKKRSTPILLAALVLVLAAVAVGCAATGAARPTEEPKPSEPPVAATASDLAWTPQLVDIQPFGVDPGGLLDAHLTDPADCAAVMELCNVGSTYAKTERLVVLDGFVVTRSDSANAATETVLCRARRENGETVYGWSVGYPDLERTNELYVLLDGAPVYEALAAYCSPGSPWTGGEEPYMATLETAENSNFSSVAYAVKARFTDKETLEKLSEMAERVLDACETARSGPLSMLLEGYQVRLYARNGDIVKFNLCRARQVQEEGWTVLGMSKGIYDSELYLLPEAEADFETLRRMAGNEAAESVPADFVPASVSVTNTVSSYMDPFPRSDTDTVERLYALYQSFRMSPRAEPDSELLRGAVPLSVRFTSEDGRTVDFMLWGPYYTSAEGKGNVSELEYYALENGQAIYETFYQAVGRWERNRAPAAWAPPAEGDYVGAGMVFVSPLSSALPYYLDLSVRLDGGMTVSSGGREWRYESVTWTETPIDRATFEALFPGSLGSDDGFYRMPEFSDYSAVYLGVVPELTNVRLIDADGQLWLKDNMMVYALVPEANRYGDAADLPERLAEVRSLYSLGRLEENPQACTAFLRAASTMRLDGWDRLTAEEFNAAAAALRVAAVGAGQLDRDRWMFQAAANTDGAYAALFLDEGGLLQAQCEAEPRVFYSVLLEQQDEQFRRTLERSVELWEGKDFAEWVPQG